MTMEVICTVSFPGMGWGGESISLTLWSDNITRWLTGQKQKEPVSILLKKKKLQEPGHSRPMASCLAECDS